MTYFNYNFWLHFLSFFPFSAFVDCIKQKYLGAHTLLRKCYEVHKNQRTQLSEKREEYLAWCEAMKKYVSMCGGLLEFAFSAGWTWVSNPKFRLHHLILKTSLMHLDSDIKDLNFTFCVYNVVNFWTMSSYILFPQAGLKLCHLLLKSKSIQETLAKVGHAHTVGEQNRFHL